MINQQKVLAKLEDLEGLVIPKNLMESNKKSFTIQAPADLGTAIKSIEIRFWPYLRALTFIVAVFLEEGLR